MAAGATLSGVGQTFKLGSSPVVSDHTQRWNVTFESADTEYEAELHIDGGGSDYFSGTIKVLKSETVADSESSDPIGYDVTFKGHGALTKAGSKLVV